MHSIRNVCVFCGSELGSDSNYVLETETLAHLLVKKIFMLSMVEEKMD